MRAVGVHVRFQFAAADGSEFIKQVDVDDAMSSCLRVGEQHKVQQRSIGLCSVGACSADVDDRVCKLVKVFDEGLHLRSDDGGIGGGAGGGAGGRGRGRARGGP